MKQTRKTFRKIWDIKVAGLVKATFEKFEGELHEHGNFVLWVGKHVLLPLCIFYVLTGLLMQQNVFDSLFLGLGIFIYSNFVPDLDSLLAVSKNAREKTNSLEKFGLLFFGPLFVYYAISNEAKPIYAKKQKEFHNVRYLLLYSLFLLAIGLLFYNNPLERLALPLFGALGYTTHLSVDGCLKLR